MAIISIIINHHKTPNLLENCLKEIKNNVSDIDCQIIVCDSETNEENEKKVKKINKNILFLGFKKNVGFGYSVNRAIEKSKGKYILIINADITIKNSESIKKMMDCFEKNPEIGLLGPVLLNEDDSKQQSCFRFYNPFTILCRRTFIGKSPLGKKALNRFLMKDVLNEKKIKNENPIPVDWLMGSAILTKSSAVKKVGLFDERFFMYFEDVDWCRRFWENGFKVVYFPKSDFYHHHIKASEKNKGIIDLFLNKYARIHLASAVKYFLKYGIKPPSYGL